jgi:hypothetical protein
VLATLARDVASGTFKGTLTVPARARVLASRGIR